MKKNLIYLFALVLVMSLNSCVDNTPADATKVSKADLMASKITGFQWFNDVYKDYEEKTIFFDAMAENISNEHSFILFGKPSCSCDKNSAESYAKIVKILDSLGAEGRYKLFVANSYKADHPYKGQCNINSLPAYFILKNGVAVYSVYDSLKKYSTLPKESKKEFEEYILEGLKK